MFETNSALEVEPVQFFRLQKYAEYVNSNSA
jgi:hypothetical protein